MTLTRGTMVVTNPIPEWGVLMSGDQQLIEGMLERFPELRDLCEVHIENNGTVLPHVLFWDVTQEFLRCYLGEESDLQDWCAFIEFLEEEYSRDDKLAREVIVTSFLDSLPFPGQPGYGIAEYLGPQLAEIYGRLRP